jgi:hypothetical protein
LVVVIPFILGPAAALSALPGKPALPNATLFVDVTPGAQFHEEISWLGSAGISTGWDEAVPAYRLRRRSFALR